MNGLLCVVKGEVTHISLYTIYLDIQGVKVCVVFLVEVQLPFLNAHIFFKQGRGAVKGLKFGINLWISSCAVTGKLNHTLYEMHNLLYVV